MIIRLQKKASVITSTIKTSLAMVIPILFVGSITVMLNGFPFQGYQDFLNSFLGGALRSVIQTIQFTTVGILAVYLTIAINQCYIRQTEEGQRLVFGFSSLLGCLTGFFILVGFFSGEPDLSLLSGQGVFSALLAGIIGSVLFQKFEALFKTRITVFVDGADSVFNAALHTVLPFLAVVLCFAVANFLITVCFQVQSVQYLFMRAVDAVFMRMHRSYFSGLLFIVKELYRYLRQYGRYGMHAGTIDCDDDLWKAQLHKKALPHRMPAQPVQYRRAACLRFSSDL